MPTASLRPHDVALETALALDHSPYDTLYAAFAIALGAEKLIVADRKFVAAMQRHSDPSLAGLLMLLGDWGTNGVTAPHT